MARIKSYTDDTLVDRALLTFWANGYFATSMDDLVRATDVSRHGIYKDFGGKKKLFLACFERYQNSIVSPAFARVEQPHADLTQIGEYFEYQITCAEKIGLPGHGCFVGNSNTEVAPHDLDVKNLVAQHNQRLKTGFANALENSCHPTCKTSKQELAQLADTIVIFATGLWSLCRSIDDAAKLRNAVTMFLSAVAGRLK